MDSILKLVAVFALVAINGIFVAAEFALVGARPTRIDQLVAKGNRWARLVKRAMDDPNRFISAAQVGITMASLGLGWLAEPAVAELLIPVLDPLLGEEGRIGAHLVAGVIALFIITLLHIVLGEQVPKMIALQRAESTVLTIAPIVSAIAVPFRPLIALLYWLTAIVLRVFRLEWQGEHHLVYSEDELKMMITASHQRGILDENEQAMINRVFGFAEMVTEQVMVPRTEIEAIPIRATLEEVTKFVADSGHSRYPVYGENLDDIRGVFHAKDVYRLMARSEQHRFNLRRMVRAPLMVAESTNLDTLLGRMKRERTQIAIVVDEYGGTAGMVTLEDVLRAFLGVMPDDVEAATPVAAPGGAVG
jgi:CBS domain containing-hemolysin-like protein